MLEDFQPSSLLAMGVFTWDLCAAWAQTQSHQVAARAIGQHWGQSHWDSHTEGLPSPICVSHRGSLVLQDFLVTR